jgi:hypothetical protein
LALDLPQALAGLVKILVFFGEAKAEQVFAATGPEEGAARDRRYARICQQVPRFFGAGFTREFRGLG